MVQGSPWRVSFPPLLRSLPSQRTLTSLPFPWYTVSPLYLHVLYLRIQLRMEIFWKKQIHKILKGKTWLCCTSNYLHSIYIVTYKYLYKRIYTYLLINEYYKDYQPDKPLSSTYTICSLPQSSAVMRMTVQHNRNAFLYRDSHGQGTKIYRDFPWVVSYQNNITSCGLYSVINQQ